MSDHKKRILIIVLATSAVALGVSVYVVNVVLSDLREARAQQELNLAAALQRKEELLEAHAFAKRQLEVVRQAQEHLREILKMREMELRETREQLELYEKVVAPKGPSGLRIHGLHLMPAAQSGHWDYRLVLYQKYNDKKIAEGHYDLLLHGQTQGTDTQYRLSKLLEDQEARSFAFRHFMTLEGSFEMPKMFDAKRIEVEVLRTGRKGEPLRESFDWATVTAALE